MDANLDFVPGKTYIVKFLDGREVEFTVVGGPDPYVIDVEGQHMKHTELLKNYTEIYEK